MLTLSPAFDLVFFFFLMIRRPPRSTLFPTRRSSDLYFVHAIVESERHDVVGAGNLALAARLKLRKAFGVDRTHGERDRKSTRLNSSHQIISYAVFCLKKKTRTGNLGTNT